MREKFNSLLLRISDRSKFPRRWWFPPEYRIEIDSAEEWKRQHDEISNTLRRVMLTLIVYSSFCLLTLAAPDVSLIASGAKIRVPFANTEVDYVEFLFIGPLILLAITVYLHIFEGHRIGLGSHQEVEKLPFIFNMHHYPANILSNFLFYWLPPLMLAAFAWKASPRRPEADSLTLLTIEIIVGLVWLQIRRCTGSRRFLKNLPRWLIIIILLSILTPEQEFRALFRPLQLANVDLSQTDLGNAMLREANLRKANLNKSVLREADLRGADLREAELSGADLRDADLIEAKLSKANMGGADLSKADLGGADLRGAINLSQTQVDNACYSDKVHFYLVGPRKTRKVGPPMLSDGLTPPPLCIKHDDVVY